MRKLHLICNAHIDPVWQWTWDEGISSALATFKSAVDLAEDFDYIFCHNESLLYEAVEKYAPALFERIKKLIKAGKWVVAGGWYLQPDCVMPSGESIVRQIKVGQAYFMEKFGVKPEIATNYDSFGHSIGLVQIMAKCGYKGYITCRPNSRQFAYPSRFFNWVAPDGSKVVVAPFPTYNSPLGLVKYKIDRVAKGEEFGMLGSEKTGGENKADWETYFVLWGVGNHGGGPSRKDLQDISEMQIPDLQLIHSTPERLFADNIDIQGEVSTSLITCMPGCYSSMARIKRAHRETENLFYATEKLLAVANMAGYKTDLRDLETAQKKLLLAQFHDILPGTVIEEGEKDGLELLSMSKKILKDYRTGAFLYLVMADKVAQEGEYPVFVFNYMPYEVQTPVEVEFSLADQNWETDFVFKPCVYFNGEEIPSQQIKEDSHLNLDWRKRVVFDAKLKPLAITRFSIRVKRAEKKVKNTEEVDLSSLLSSEKYPLKNPVELLTYDDTADPWGMSDAELKEMGTNPVAHRLMTAEETQDFCVVNQPLAPVRIIENGDIFTAVEGLYTCGKTNTSIVYKLYKNKPYLDLKITTEFADKNKLLRLKIPAPKGVAIGDGPYIVEEKPDCESVFQKWYGVKTQENVFAVINDGVYAGKSEDGALYLTLLRGCGYCMHPIGDRELYVQDRYLKRIDCGRYEYNLRIFCGSISEVCAQAELFNQPPYAINVFPTGGGVSVKEISTDSEVVMPVCKISEEGGYVFRFYNPDGMDREFTLTVGEKKEKILLKGYEILTVEYNGDFVIRRDEISV